MHWGGRFLSGTASHGINDLTIGALDPSSYQPELKHCAVRITPLALPWRLVAFGGAQDVSFLFEALGAVMQSVPHATRTLIGRERAGVRLVLAAHVAPAKEVLDRIDAPGAAVEAYRLRVARFRTLALWDLARACSMRSARV